MDADSDTRIVTALLAADDRFVTGNSLAGLLGVSRVSVWSHIQNLREQGFEIEAVRNRGYRIRKRPSRLSLPCLQALLPDRAGCDGLVFHAVTGSTNQDAERLLAADKPDPFVVIARRQTEGRGRLGRSWHSADEGNLYASFAFRPRVAPERIRQVTLWIGARLCQLLEEETGITPGIKWPNDLCYRDRKIGGILTEARVNADQILSLVFGLGLNVNSRPATWPEPLCRQAASLREAAGDEVDINGLTARLIPEVLDAYDTFLTGGHREEFDALWKRFDILNGRHITGYRDNETVRGTATGIDSEGQLILETESGEEFRLNAGDVSLTTRPPPTGHAGSGSPAYSDQA